MSSPLSAAFLAAWRSSERQPVALVRVEITEPTPLALYLASDPVTTPDGQTWGPGIDPGVITHATDFLSGSVPLARFDFTLLDAEPSELGAAGISLLESLSAYRWSGATVTVYLWERSLADFADAAQVFAGFILPGIEYEGRTAHLFAQQRNDWNLQLPATEVSKDANPRAPERYQGRAVPICYGSLRDVPARSPASEYDSNGFIQYRPYVIGGARASRGVMTRIGRGAGGEKTRILFASHACKTFDSHGDGCRVFLEHNGVLCPVIAATSGGASTVINGSSGTGFEIDDISSAGVEPAGYFFPQAARDVLLPAANAAESPRSGLDALNDTSYAVLDYDAGKRDITFKVPKVGSPGTGLGPYSVIGYMTSAACANLRVDVGDSGGGGPSTYTPAASTTPKGAYAVYPTTETFAVEVYIRVYFTGVATGQWCRIFYVGLTNNFRPSWSQVTPARYGYAAPNDPGTIEGRVNLWQRGKPAISQVSGPVTETKSDGEYFATLDGYADDGSGTYTGTASALIERAPDVLRHLLVTHCAQAAGDVETGASTFGSFVLAREALKTWRLSDMRAALSLSDFAQASDWITMLAEAALGLAYLSRFDDKWHFHVWRAGAAVDYDLTLEATHGHVLDDAGPRCSLTEPVNDIEVLYGWDDWSRRFQHTTAVSHSRSRAGWKYRDLRDCNLTVVSGSNDKLEWTDDTGSHTATLTAGTYDDETILTEVSTRLNAVSTTHCVGLGCRIVAGVNDTIRFYDGSVHTVTIPDALYPSMEDLATAAQDAMNAVSSSVSVTYSRTTRKFTFSIGTASKELRWNGGAAAVFGFIVKTYAGPGPWTADFETEEERFIVTTSNAVFTLQPETGATYGINAATPRQAWGLLGFDPVRDLTAARGYTAHAPKNGRENDLATSAARYGKTRRRRFDLRAVLDTDTARTIRNRVADLVGEPRVIVAFRTEVCPDMEIGRVFAFGASVDALAPYPGAGSDGSWAGKKFVALEVHQNLGTTWDQEIVAVECS